MVDGAVKVGALIVGHVAALGLVEAAFVELTELTAERRLTLAQEAGALLRATARHVPARRVVFARIVAARDFYKRSANYRTPVPRTLRDISLTPINVKTSLNFSLRRMW